MLSSIRQSRFFWPALGALVAAVTLVTVGLVGVDYVQTVRADAYAAGAASRDAEVADLHRQIGEAWNLGHQSEARANATQVRLEQATVQQSDLVGRLVELSGSQTELSTKLASAERRATEAERKFADLSGRWTETFNRMRQESDILAGRLRESEKRANDTFKEVAAAEARAGAFEGLLRYYEQLAEGNVEPDVADLAAGNAIYLGKTGTRYAQLADRYFARTLAGRQALQECDCDPNRALAWTLQYLGKASEAGLYPRWLLAQRLTQAEDRYDELTEGREGSWRNWYDRELRMIQGVRTETMIFRTR